MKYIPVQSLLDLKVGKVYFKDGKAHLIESKTEDSIKGLVDQKEQFTIELTKETLENYVDSVFYDHEANLFYQLKRDEEYRIK